MRVFTPEQPLALPMKTGDVLTNRLLREDEPYLVNDGTAASMEQLIRVGAVKGRIEEAERRPFAGAPDRALLMFSGDVGDALMTWLCCRNAPTVDFVAANLDHVLFPDYRAVYQYPITLRQADFYNAWVEFDARADQSMSPVESLFAALGSPHMSECGMLSDDLHSARMADCLENYAGRLASSIEPNSTRPSIGIRIHADSHYRSWNPAMACVTMAGLVEAGFDCYVLGDNRHRISMKRDGEKVSMWGDGMFDTCGLFATVEEYVSFVSLMDVVIAPDSGTLYIAAALGVPGLGLFGPTSGEAVTKWLSGCRYIQGAMACSPCRCIGDHATCEGRACDALTNIQPEEIVETVKHIYKEPRQ